MHKQVQAVQNIIAVHVNMAIMSGGHFSTLIRMALQAPHRLCNAMSPSATFPVIWDSGASISITHERSSDFVGPITNPGPLTQLQGIAKGLWIEGEGHVMWTMEATAGSIRMIKVPAYLVSTIKIGLLSTKSLLQIYPNKTITTSLNVLISCRIGRLLQKSLVGSVLYVDQLLVQLKHVELEYLSLTSSVFVKASPPFDVSRETGSVVQSAVVIVAAFGGILEKSMGGGRAVVSTDLI